MSGYPRFLRLALAAVFLWLVVAAPVRATGTADGGVEVMVVVDGPSSGELVPVKGTLLWTPSGAGEPVSVPVDGAGRYRIPFTSPEAGRAAIGTVSAEISGYWAPPTVVATTEGAVQVVLLPTGAVEATVEVPDEAEPPAALELEFGPASFLQSRAASPSARASGRLRCPVEEGRLRCEVPAGRHDLRWHAPGFATVLQWEVVVAARETVRVPDLELIPGGAILGFVEIARDAPPAADGEHHPRVALSVAAPEQGQHDTLRRLAYLEQEVEVGPDGSFQFRGLPAGSYRITARSEGLAADRQPVVEVLEARESRLPFAIRLEPQVTQDVHVLPPTTPDGRPWRVHLYPAGAAGSGFCVTGPSGNCRMPPLAAGEYRLVVRDTAETKWHERQVDLHRNPVPLEVELPLVPVAGTVTRDGDPVRARLIFHRGRGKERVETYSDFDGRFTGFVPEEGEWFVAANLEPRGIELALETVDVVRPAGGEPFLVDLEIPDTQLQGRVIDAVGQPVARVRLFLAPVAEGETSGATGSGGWSDEEGRFRVWGLEEGRWRVRVSDGDRSATSDPVEVREGEVARVEVRMPGRREVRGRIVSGGRPVAGAQVVIWPVLPLDRGGGVQSTALSGPNGAFTALVPENTAAADVAVLAPGYAVHLLRFAAITDDVLEIGIDTWAGTLELRDPAGLVVGHRLARGPAELGIGTLLPWSTLFGLPPRLGGPTYTLPQMAPGPYRFCSPDHSRCADGELTIGGHLVLDLGDGEE